MAPPMFPFTRSGYIINVPGHYKGYVCHSCPGTAPGHDIYMPPGWTLKSCQPISSAGGYGCATHLFVALIETVHQDFVGENTHPIEVRSTPPGAKISIK